MQHSRVTLLLFPVALAFGQHHHAPPPEKPVALYKGLGNWTHPIATRVPDAQRYFDQGLILLYGFNRYESLRSFRKAAELDPAALMPVWGMAMSQGPYVNMDGDPSYDQKGACSAVEAGRKLTAAPARERDYLNAVAAICPEYQGQKYIDAARRLAERYPDDPDAATLFAESIMVAARWRWYKADGTPAPGMPDAERALEQVLRRHPDHPGANHYYIHAVESSPTPERAIASAQRLMGVVPWAGHMVHMPGHIWLVLGDWELAAGVNQRAAQVDSEYFTASQVVGGTYMPYYIHNLHFILYARSMQGRQADSVAAADRITSELPPMVAAIPEMADAFASMALFTHARFNRWDAILKLPAPPPALKAATAFWNYSRALAFAARQDFDSARRASEAFRKGAAAIPADAPWGQSKASQIFALAGEILEARAKTSPEAQVPHWRRAVEMQDALIYDEPPDWYYPLRESLGAALVRAGQAAEAETVLREGVKRSPHNGRMLFALLASLEAQGKKEDAAWVRREFEAAWAKADIRLRLEDL